MTVATSRNTLVRGNMDITCQKSRRYEGAPDVLQFLISSEFFSAEPQRAYKKACFQPQTCLVSIKKTFVDYKISGDCLYICVQFFPSRIQHIS